MEFTYENLRNWFNKEDWVRIDTQGNIAGKCGTMKKGKKTQRCLPRAKANRLSKKERAATARKKTRSKKQYVKNTKKAKVKLKKENQIEMKKSELRKIIRETISEQFVTPPSTYCEPGPNCAEPYLNSNQNEGEGLIYLVCPTGFVFQHPETNLLFFGNANRNLMNIPRCVPDIGNPGDENMAGHGSTDNPFVPGMGFEDQFIDQITGPGGPFGGKTPPPPIRESKKRRK